MVNHRGSCHCGRVTFEFSNPIRGILECNCSICHRKGALWHAADEDHFRILSGKDELAVYQFGTKTAKHFFCKQCGTSTFSNPRLAPSMWAINLRCVDDVDLDALPRQQFDGRNWEEAAQDFLRARVSSPD
jgi:hypothetical protein